MKDFKTTINGHEYYLNQWDAMKAMKKQFDIIEIFGEALLKVAVGNTTEKNLLSHMGIGLIMSVQRNDNDKVIALIEDVVKSAIRDGERIQSIGTTYDGATELAEMYAAFIWILQANYSAFFDLAKDIFSEPENWSV